MVNGSVLEAPEDFFLTLVNKYMISVCYETLPECVVAWCGVACQNCPYVAVALTVEMVIEEEEVKK